MLLKIKVEMRNKKKKKKKKKHTKHKKKSGVEGTKTGGAHPHLAHATYINRIRPLPLLRALAAPPTRPPTTTFVVRTCEHVCGGRPPQR